MDIWNYDWDFQRLIFNLLLCSFFIALTQIHMSEQALLPVETGQAETFAHTFFSDFLCIKSHRMKVPQLLCKPFKQSGFTASRRPGYQDVVAHSSLLRCQVSVISRFQVSGVRCQKTEDKGQRIIGFWNSEYGMRKIKDQT